MLTRHGDVAAGSARPEVRERRGLFREDAEALRLRSGGIGAAARSRSWVPGAHGREDRILARRGDPLQAIDLNTAKRMRQRAEADAPGYMAEVGTGSELIPASIMGENSRALELADTVRGHGASTRSCRKAARNVIVVQWPCGTLAGRRSPRGDQPRSGAIWSWSRSRR